MQLTPRGTQQGQPLLLLTTRGAKTGKRRPTTLVWFADDPARPDSWLVERERAWRRIVALAPGYGKYEVKTDREIPVVRLTRRPTTA